MENKNLFRRKVGGRRRMLAVSERRCKKFCMCNRHDKRVLGGAMMVGSSDLETISPVCLTFSYFCSRAPLGFLCRGPLGSPHPSEPRIIWPGASLVLVQPRWMGRRGLGNRSLQQGACSICLEPLQVGKGKQPPILPKGRRFETLGVCNLQWRAQSPVEAPVTGAG